METIIEVIAADEEWPKWGDEFKKFKKCALDKQYSTLETAATETQSTAEAPTANFPCFLNRIQ